VLQQLPQDREFAVDRFWRAALIAARVLIRGQIRRRDLSKRLVTEKRRQRTTHFLPPDDHACGDLRSSVVRVSLDRRVDAQRAERARSLRRIRRPFLEFSDPLLLEIPRLTPVGGAERFAMPLTVDDDVDPVLRAAFPQSHDRPASLMMINQPRESTIGRCRFACTNSSRSAAK
jgi:hypothetical protein